MSDKQELAVRGASGTLAVRTMDDLARLGNMLATSGYFNDAREAAQAGVKVLAGLEMGIGAFSAMSGIHIIEGKPSVGAGLMAAAVKRSEKYDYRVTKHTPTECLIAFYEAGELLGESSFTIDDAKAAGVAFKTSKGYPTPWAKNPRNMLFARALSNGVRWYCPDVFDVSTYTHEELGAEVDDDGNMIEVQAAPRKAEPKALVPVKAEPKTALERAADVAEAALEQMVDEVVAELTGPEPVAPAAIDPDVAFGTEPETPELFKDELITGADVKAVAAAMKPLGLDADTAKAVVELAINREIPGGIKSLTRGEGTMLAGWDTDKWANATDLLRSPMPEEDAA